MILASYEVLHRCAKTFKRHYPYITTNAYFKPNGGLFDINGKIIANENEAEIYKKLEMQYPEPEMRENKGEIELAQQGKLPKLVSLENILGDLHVHSRHSDGLNTIEEMTTEAQKLGRKYIGFTDHSKTEYIAHGMDEKRFVEYSNEIDLLNEKFYGKIKILKSAETDILKDGALDFSNDALEKMDYVLASVHTNINMPKDEMTKRVISAIESGYVNILGHPTDRIINQRPPINLDLDKVFQAAKDNNVIMEIDSYPDRLDLNDENILKAKEYGLKFSISTDSHRTQHLLLMRYGIGTAKRGWLKKDDIINTYSLEKLLNIFKK